MSDDGSKDRFRFGHPRRGVCDIEVGIKQPCAISSNLEAAIEVTTPEGDDGVGSSDCPEHAGLFEAGTDYRLAAGFDDTGSDEQVLTAEFRVAHARGIFFKVMGLI